MDNMNVMSKENEVPAEIQKFGGYISKLIFNNGLELSIKENDIVVFVGPNNAGKSQSLKDIYELCDTKKTTIVVKDIEIVKSGGDITEFLNNVSTVDNNGNYLGFGYNIASYSILGYNSNEYFGCTRPVFVTYLDTLKRLTISNPASLINRKEVKSNPIHYAALNKTYRKWLGDNFKKAFGKELIPHILNGGSIPLCIGDAVKFDKDFSDEQERQEAYAEVLDTYKQVQNQGDGIKSFTGILLYLMLDYYSIFLIDEPESFLHPPQANIMGRIIGQTLQNKQQAFISTHSEEIIKGLLEACPGRVKIVRITRNEDSNNFSVLENDRFNEIWNDPLLKYSNIMTSLFHKDVVLCESDSDCKMYSIIDNSIKQKKGKYSETLYVHCGGKHRMAKIAKALRSLDISVKLIPDIDVLNDENVFKGIIEAFGIEWDDIRGKYNTIVSNLHSPKEKIARNDVCTKVNKICKDSDNQYLSRDEVKEIKEIISVISKWDAIKKGGASALPSGDATVAFNEMNKILKNAGIYIVPVGELECFVKEVGGHGPEWTNSVFERFPNLDDEVYDEIKKFVGMIHKTNGTQGSGTSVQET